MKGSLYILPDVIPSGREWSIGFCLASKGTAHCSKFSWLWPPRFPVLILKEITKISARDFTNFLDPSGTREARLVLVVPEVCAGCYGAGRAGAQSARGAERLVG